MEFHANATRIWKGLAPDERLRAASAFFAEPPAELIGAAVAALVNARHLRPQAARALPPDAQARILATVLDPGEPVAQGLLVGLHLADRRPLLRAFLDGLKLAHEDGILKEEADSGPPLSEAELRAAVAGLGAFPADQVRTYLNTLWLQDKERWRSLESL